jgi:hypothetical protein
MKRSAKRYLVTALLIGCVHFVLVLSLSMIVSTRIASMMDGSYHGTFQQVYRLDKVVGFLTFPVSQLLYPTQPYSTGTNPSVERIAPFLLPMSSVLWGAVLAFGVVKLLPARRKDSVEQPGA